MAQVRKIISSDERSRQLSRAVSVRDLQKLKTIVADYESRDEFTSEFYACLYELCDRKKSDDEVLKIMLSCQRFDVNKTQTNGETILHALIRNNHYQWVEHLLKSFSNLDVNATCKEMKTPFLLAAEYGHIEVLELLEPIVQNIHCCDIKKYSALHWMAKHGNLKWVKYLVEEKAFSVDQKNVYGDTPINRAVAFGQYECCQYFFKKGASVVEIDIDGRTLLHTAVFGENVECVDAVLEHLKEKSFVHFKDIKGRTALNWAAGNGYKEIVKSLLRANADVNDKDLDGKTPLMNASVGGHEDIIKLLIDANANIDVEDVNEKKYQPLTRAASKGHMGTVKVLLDAGANVNATDDLGMTALDWASAKGNESLLYYLLQHEKIDVNSNTSIGGYSPLMRAAKQGNVNMLMSLIKSKANVDQQNSNGSTALILAVVKNALWCVVELIYNNANLDLKDNKGQTAFMIAKKRTCARDIIQVLKNAGAR